MEVGRKIYYEISTGNVVYPPLESCSNGILTTKEQDFLNYSFLKTLDSTKYDFIQLAFSEKESELQNMGSCHIDPATKELTVYPRLTILTDKAQITANGTDTATITVSGVSTDVVTFSINGVDQTPTVTPTNGSATFLFATNALGTFTIGARTNLYGQNSLTVKGV